jgi:tetratricopeptide (TPR) repeat protein
MPLEDRTIRCPKCNQLTKLAVATPRQTESTYSTTHCRKCSALFICLTLDDGVVLVFDRESIAKAEAQTPKPLLMIPSSRAEALFEMIPRHLGVFDRGTGVDSENYCPGISDEDLASGHPVSLDRLLRFEDGRKREPSEAAKYVGWRSIWLAQLNEAIRERLAGPPPLTYPPAIFISYRWGTDEENQWVTDLAAELRARGYPVDFDREMPEGLTVPQFVSRIADARVFLAVLDPGYEERIGGPRVDRLRDGWVWDEHQTALAFSNTGDLEIVGFWRSGENLPHSFYEASFGKTGNACDVRQGEQLIAILSVMFPGIQAPLSDTTLGEARSLLASSHAALRSGQYEEALDRAAHLTSLLPNTVDGPVQMIRVAQRAQWHDVALDAAERALILAPQHPELLVAAGTAAANLNNPQRAIGHLGAFLESSPQSPELLIAQARLAISSSLDDVDQVFPAIAHCELAQVATVSDPIPYQTLAFLYRRINDPERAVEVAEKGLTVAPGHLGLLLHAVCANFEAGRILEARSALFRLESAGADRDQVELLAGLLDTTPRSLSKPVQLPRNPIWVKCSNCPARVPVRSLSSLICNRCGSVLETGNLECPNCSSTGRIVLGFSDQPPWKCPYCRAGSLELH